MMSFSRSLAAVVCAASTLFLSGCSLSPTGSSTVAGPALQGTVHGGNQPVSGASIQLYAVTTAGYGNTATALLRKAVTTSASGSFSIANDYTCPTGGMVYIVATGGNPGASGTQTNTALAMMTGLGTCTGLTSATTISVNELTTVASVWALAPFMTSISSASTSATNTQGLANAFASINKLVNTSVGTMPGPTLPTGAAIPTTEINTIADILATCINSVNSSATVVSGNCTSLFSATTPSGSAAPTNTVQAALNMAKNPTLGLVALTTLVAATGTPYQPSMGGTVPNSWTIAINYVPASLVTPRGIAVDATGDLWIPDSGNNTVTELANTGAVISGSGYGIGTLNSPSAIAIDASGLPWITNSGNNSVTHIAGDGTGTKFTGGGLNIPMGIAIDSQGSLWISNSGNSSISQFSSAGAAVSTTSGYTGGGLNQPVAVAVGSN
jgi:hypothetical protein